MKKLSIFSLASMLITTPLHPTEQKIKLKSELLLLADGAFINADTLELMKNFQREISNIIFNHKKSEDNTYSYKGNQYTIDELVAIEHEQGLDKEMQVIFKKAKTKFILLCDEFREFCHNSKSIITALIAESCAAHNRMNSLLLMWSKTNNKEEEEHLFDEYVHNFKIFKAVCMDLHTFLEDLIYSCPKAQEQLRIRLKKWELMMPFIAELYTKAEPKDKVEFLKYIKRNHLDRLKNEDITKSKIEELKNQHLKHKQKQ